MSKPITSPVPRYRTASHHICMAIYKHGKPVTIDEGIELHGYKGHHRFSLMKKHYENAAYYCWLIETDGKYFVSPAVAKYFDGFTSVAGKHSELVKPRYHPQKGEMKPIERDPRLRNISFVTSGTVTEPVMANWSPK